MSVIARIFATHETNQTDRFGSLRFIHDSFGGRETDSGIPVDPASALRLDSYYAAIRNISEDLAKLPWWTLQRTGERSTRRAIEHPTFGLLHKRSSPEISSMAWQETMLSWALGWGNGYSVITRGARTRLDLFHPSRVRVFRNDAGLIRYELTSHDGRQRVLPQESIFHLHGLGDGFVGFSIAQLAANSVGLGLALEQFGSKFFKDGTSAAGVFKTPAALGDDAFAHLKDSWPKGLPNAHKPLFLEQGMEWQSITVPPDQAQMIESRMFSVETMARWFRMPPHKLQKLSDATFSNIHDQNKEYVVDTLTPWATRFEAEADFKLFSPAERETFFTMHDFDALLRGSPVERAERHGKLFQIAVESPNDIRFAEGLSPIPGEMANKYFVPQNLHTLEQAAVEKTSNPPRGRFDGQDAPQEPDREAIKKAFIGTFHWTFGRLWRKDSKAVKRAAAKHDGKFEEWAEDFYRKHQVDMLESLQDQCMSMAELIAGEDVQLVGLRVDKCLVGFIDCCRRVRFARIMASPEDGLVSYLESSQEVDPLRLACELTEAIEAAVSMENEHVST